MTVVFGTRLQIVPTRTHDQTSEKKSPVAGAANLIEARSPSGDNLASCRSTSETVIFLPTSTLICRTIESCPVDETLAWGMRFWRATVIGHNY